MSEAERNGRERLLEAQKQEEAKLESIKREKERLVKEERERQKKEDERRLNERQEVEQREREQKDRDRKERERQEAEIKEKQNEERQQQELLMMVETKRSDWIECLQQESWSTSKEVLGKEEIVLQVSACFSLAVVSITDKILCVAIFFFKIVACTYTSHYKTLTTGKL